MADNHSGDTGASSSASQTWIKPLQSLVYALHALRAVLLPCLVSGILLSVPDQTHDYYRVLAENPSIWRATLDLGFGAALQMVMAVLTLPVCIAAYFILGSVQVQSLPADPRKDFFWSQPILSLLRWLITASPLLAIAIGLWLASSQVASVQTPGIISTDGLTKATLARWSIWSMALCCLVVALSWWLDRIAVDWPAKVAGAYKSHPTLLSSLLAFFVFAILFVLSDTPVGTPAEIGPLPYILLFGMWASVILIAVCHYAARISWHGITVLVAIAIAFSLLQWNDNHAIRVGNGATTSAEMKVSSIGEKGGGQSNSSVPALPITVGDAFAAWYASRPDKDQFDEYPVYVVAAQGGGIYAAQHGALFLARLQDRCPSFAHHTFAISSVSGGSLGAALFQSLVREREAAKASPAIGCLPLIPKIRGTLEAPTQQFLARDFLSPVLAAGLFPDLTQRFLPFAVNTFDRARALEYGLESSWEQVGERLAEQRTGKKKDKTWSEFALGRGHHNPSADNLFAANFGSHWSPTSKAPALVLNTTEVGTGQRILIMPFSLRDSTAKTTATALADLRPDFDMPLSVAVGLSARFPFVMPVGWIDYQAANKTIIRARLADGGYFENSGIDTAIDLSNEMTKAIPKLNLPAGKRIRIILVALAGTATQVPDNIALAELDPPFRTLLNTRGARARLAMERAEAMSDRTVGSTQGTAFEARVVQFDAARLGLPLGWILSEQSRNRIAIDIGTPEDCDPGAMNETARKNTAPCVARMIYQELVAARPPTPQQ